jgi:hypothetical protein
VGPIRQATAFLRRCPNCGERGSTREKGIDGRLAEVDSLGLGNQPRTTPFVSAGAFTVSYLQVTSDLPVNRSNRDHFRSGSNTDRISFWVHVIVATSRGDVHHRRTLALDIRTECRRGLTFHNVFFALLGGLQVFGGLGVFIGPITLAITFALLKFLREEKRAGSWSFDRETSQFPPAYH